MTWGLALSGGAALGLANAGVVQVLEREGLKPDYVAGSSMGAIIAALYAYTGSSKVLTELCSTLNLSNVARVSDSPFKGGLQGGIFRQHLEHHLAAHLGDATIGDCAIPFVCVAGKVTEPIDWLRVMKPGFTDYVLKRVSLHVFPPQTRILDAIMASSAIPVVFSPVVIGGDTFVDLVHFGSIPARTLRERYHPDIVIGTDTNPSYKKLKPLLPASWLEFLERGYAEIEQSRKACDLLIAPDMPAAVFRFDKATAFLTAGAKATNDKMSDIRELLL